MRTLRIDLKDRGYAIQLGRNLLSRLHEFLPQPFQRAVLVSNPELLRLHGAAARTGLEAGGLQVDVAVVPEGESHKTLQDAENLFDFLLRHRCDRKTLIVALGGGVIGDLAGFVAATYQRGVPYLQVPTTLLAQVDSSVGGKTAVNHPLGKNMIGAFYQPCAVVADFDTLHTLPAEEFRCGLAEVIKYGIIADPALFDYLEKNPQPILAQETASLERIIETSCAIKAQVVEQDEQEANFRMVLNFGHTLAHAVEALTGYTRFKHGEAVAIGMVYAARLSNHLGKCSPETVARIQTQVERFGLPSQVPKLSPRQYVESMRRDKKAHGARIRFILVHEIGRIEIADAVAEEDLLACLSG